MVHDDMAAMCARQRAWRWFLSGASLMLAAFAATIGRKWLGPWPATVMLAAAGLAVAWGGLIVMLFG